MSAPEPQSFAARWIAAWNGRDVEAVLRDYADDVVFTSPTAQRFVPESAGTVRGKQALRRYWMTALAATPDLHFELLGVYAGVDTLVIHYRTQLNGLVSEVLTFRDGLVCFAHATHISGAAEPGQRNKQLVRTALAEIYAQGDVSLAAQLFHPDYVDHEPSHPELPTGPQSVVRTVQGLHQAFGDLRFEIEDEIADGDRVVQLVTMSGRQVGPLAGREATGRSFAVRHIYIWRIAGGRILEHWGSRNDLGLLEQLGVLSVDWRGPATQPGDGREPQQS